MAVDPCGFSVKRTCDLCGVSREAKPGVFRMVAGRMVCSSHDGYVPLEVHDARPRRSFRVDPLKNARPFNPRDTYEAAESEILAFVADNYLVEGFDFTSDGGATSLATSNKARAPGWAGIYLYELIAEAKRPHRVIAVATAKLREIADYLLTLQFAGPHRLNGITDTDGRWGGFSDDGSLTGSVATWTTQDNAAAGLTLLRAYQVLGDAKYLGAARAALWYIRTAQCGGRPTSLYSSTGYLGAGSRYHSGTWPRTIVWSAATPAPDHKFSPGALVALEFYKAFLDAVGDETIGSTSTATGFNSSRAALLSAAIAEAKVFWLTTGPTDSVRAVPTLGLSATSPLDYFWSYSALGDAAQTGAWMYSDGPQASGTLVTGLDWALGIRALHKVDGASAAVTALFDWLMTFTSSTTFELPAARSIALELAAAKGTYDPATALSTSLQVRASGADVKRNGTSFYSLATAGALGALFSSRQGAGFKALKDSLNLRRRRRDGAGPTHMLGPMGICGLSLQPWSAAGVRRSSVYLAALTGLIYRQPPVAFTGRGPQ